MAVAKPHAVDPLERWMRAIARDRDREAFTQLFEALAPRVKGYLCRGVDDRAAEDLTQEVFVRVWRSAHGWDPARGSVQAWVFAIARNASIDRRRRERHPTWDPTELDPADDPEAEASRAQLTEHVNAALDALPPEQLAVLEAAYFEQRTLSEVAADEGIPLGTVKSRVRLALARLRDVFSSRSSTPDRGSRT